VLESFPDARTNSTSSPSGSYTPPPSGAKKATAIRACAYSETPASGCSPAACPSYAGPACHHVIFDISYCMWSQSTSRLFGWQGTSRARHSPLVRESKPGFCSDNCSRAACLGSRTPARCLRSAGPAMSFAFRMSDRLGGSSTGLIPTPLSLSRCSARRRLAPHLESLARASNG
jgi:hypothetical protein